MFTLIPHSSHVYAATRSSLLLVEVDATRALYHFSQSPQADTRVQRSSPRRDDGIPLLTVRSSTNTRRPVSDYSVGIARSTFDASRERPRTVRVLFFCHEAVNGPKTKGLHHHRSVRISSRHQGLAKPSDRAYIAFLSGRQVDSEECQFPGEMPGLLGIMRYSGI